MMAGLSLAATSAQTGATAHVDAYAGMLQGLKLTCELMNAGFEQVCLHVEHIIRKAVAEATAHDWEFVWLASADLDAWTTALKPLLECKGVPDTEVQRRMAHTQATGLKISKSILEHSGKIAEAKKATRGTVQSALENPFKKPRNGAW